VFLTVPDDAITPIQDQIAWRADQIAVHCSGALPAAALVRASQCGASVGGFHPLQTLADMENGLHNLPGSTIGIEADDGTWPVLREMAERIATRPLRLRSENRAIYHVGSVIASNFTVALMSLATELWATIGITPGRATEALAPLLGGTARNIQTLGANRALTGPVARGDIGTVSRHRAALAEIPEALAVYDLMSRRLVEVALADRRISMAQAESLLDALGPTEGL
jgi:predicted short-subunit dehydrogenase-like oxidoreductase (DUF2520 family)